MNIPRPPQYLAFYVLIFVVRCIYFVVIDHFTHIFQFVTQRRRLKKSWEHEWRLEERRTSSSCEKLVETTLPRPNQPLEWRPTNFQRVEYLCFWKGECGLIKVGFLWRCLALLHWQNVCTQLNLFVHSPPFMTFISTSWKRKRRRIFVCQLFFWSTNCKSRKLTVR